MEVSVQLHDRTQGEVCLLPDWYAREDASRLELAGIASLILHIGAVLVLVFVPLSDDPGVINLSANQTRSTPLIAPPRELTQTEPNREKVGKEFTLENLLPKHRVFIPPSPPSAAIPAPAPRASAIPEPPKIDMNLPLAQLPPASGVPSAPPPPQIQAKETPKIALETPGAPGGTGASAGQPRLQIPSTSVNDAARAVASGRAGGGGMVVGDLDLGGIGGGLNLPPAPGKVASTLELLSDPMGVDFHPYLIRILATVKRNWWAVIPESAKMGRGGRVAIVFAINRDGSVPKLVIGSTSGTLALDRAAVAGISASNPFPPLPRDFKGEQVRLQFTFLYNVRTN